MLSAEENKVRVIRVALFFFLIQTSNKSIKSTRDCSIEKHLCYFLASSYKWRTWETLQMYLRRWFTWTKIVCKQTGENETLFSWIQISRMCRRWFPIFFIWQWKRDRDGEKDSNLNADESDEFLFFSHSRHVREEGKKEENKANRVLSLSTFIFSSYFPVPLENPVRDRDGSNSSLSIIYLRCTVSLGLKAAPPPTAKHR